MHTEKKYQPYIPPKPGENRLNLKQLRCRIWDLLSHDALSEIPFSGDALIKGKFKSVYPYLRLDSYTKGNALIQAYQIFKNGGAEVRFGDVQLAWDLVWCEIETGLCLDLGKLFRYSSWAPHELSAIVGIWGQADCGSCHESIEAGVWYVWGAMRTKQGTFETNKPRQLAIECLGFREQRFVNFELLPLSPLPLWNGSDNQATKVKQLSLF